MISGERLLAIFCIVMAAQVIPFDELWHRYVYVVLMCFGLAIYADKDVL